MSEVERSRDDKILAVIPVRGGSKGIPGKNIKSFCGRPLLEWTVEVALGSKMFHRVIVSTDDEQIASVGRASGVDVPFLRPAALASDQAGTAGVIAHTLQFMKDEQAEEYDYVCVLEATSPGRRIEHIREAMIMLVESGADSLAGISVVPHHYVPEKCLTRSGEGLISGLDGRPVADMRHRRQDLEVCYAFNGLIWACRTRLLFQPEPTLWGTRVLGYEVPNIYAIDLDEPDDWPIAEAQMRTILAMNNGEAR